MAGKVSPGVVEVCKKFVLSNDELCTISNRLLESMKKGLSKSGHPTAAVKCFPTYVQDFPTGNEVGDFMALDLGGTNFRVLKVTLGPGNKFSMVKEKYAFPEEMKVGTGEKLFDHVADCVDDFCNKHNLKSGKNLLPMGFTFSFPVSQVSLNKGVLVKWTKGFNASDVVGKDVVALLEEAFHRKQLNDVLSTLAILNDTTGTLMACGWEYPDTRIGLIVGTGCNACYTEKLENIETAVDADPSKPLMVVNIEWGNFGADGKIDDFLTEFDKALDAESIHPKNATFEKCMAGMYLGELVRRVLVKLIENKTILGGKGSEKMSTPETFLTEFITDIERESPGTYENGKAAFAAMDIKNPSEQDLIDLRYICECISGRSAAFVSAGIATLINKMEINPVTVGVDGTVYRRHPRYKSIMEEKIRCMIKPELNFKLVLSEDGSGRGAAFVAAVLQEQVKNKK